MIGHAPVREKAGGWRRTGASLAERSCCCCSGTRTTNSGGRRDAVCRSDSLKHFLPGSLIQKTKMAYHSPYRAPMHVNAPPDQGFLWNIFQRWVRWGRVVLRCVCRQNDRVCVCVGLCVSSRLCLYSSWVCVCVGVCVCVCVSVCDSGAPQWNEGFVSSRVSSQLPARCWTRPTAASRHSAGPVTYRCITLAQLSYCWRSTSEPSPHSPVSKTGLQGPPGVLERLLPWSPF